MFDASSRSIDKFFMTQSYAGLPGLSFVFLLILLLCVFHLTCLFLPFISFEAFLIFSFQMQLFMHQFLAIFLEVLLEPMGYPLVLVIVL